MTDTPRSPRTKAIGWYAVQRVQIVDWLKPRRAKPRAHNDSTSDSDVAENIQSSPPKTSMAEEYTHTVNNEEKKSGEPESDTSGVHNDSKHEEKLRAVVKESHTILVKAHSVFPFQLFPDTINVDRHKLTIIRRQFFGIEQKVSVPLENVKNIEADLGPFFGSIIITSDLFINNTQHLNFLWRDEAKKIQKLVQGAVVAQTENIDLNKIETIKLRSMLIDLGSGHSQSM